MPLVLIWCHIQFRLFPYLIDLTKAYLDSKLFGGCPRDVIDFLSMLVKAPLNNLLQRELIRLGIKRSPNLSL